MKILILTYFMKSGGAERVASIWANELASRGHEVGIYSDFSEPQTYHLSPSVKKLPSVPWLVGNPIGKAVRNIRTFFSLRRALRQFQPDVVINVLHSFTPMLFAAVKGMPHIRLLSTEHNSFERPPGTPFSRKQLREKFSYNRLYQGVSVLTYPDKVIADAAQIKNVHVLHNPLFATPLSSVPTKEKTVLAVGRLDVWHYKGFDVLIKAWQKIADAHPDWSLRIIGDSTPKALDLLQDIAKGCRSIEFMDYTTNIIDEYKRAAIFCLSSRYEGWGLVLTEAMSQRCACVACDFKGRQAEIITDGVDGLLCEPDNVDALAERLDFLMSDEAALRKLQEKAAANLAQFSIPAVVDRLEAVIASL